MSRTMLCLAACVLVGLATCGCRKAAEKTTEKVVKYGKEAGGGISEGIEKGRKSSRGTDGAIIISSHDELARYAKTSIYTVVPVNKTVRTIIVLAIENSQASPLRLTDIHKTGNFALVDKEGFCVPLNEGLSASEMTVLPKAKQKLDLYFDVTADHAQQVRVYGHDYPIDQSLISKQSPPE